jgi:hypothetical protein
MVPGLLEIVLPLTSNVLVPPYCPGGLINVVVAQLGLEGLVEQVVQLFLVDGHSRLLVDV